MNKHLPIYLVLTFISVLFCLPLHAQTIQIDSKYTPYAKTSGVSGTLNSVGSDTLNNLMAQWGEHFRKLYPNVNIQVEGKGSSTAPPALIEGVSQIGPMSRAMKNSEAEAFEKRFGYKPTAVAVAVDTLAVYVHRNNPLKGLTLAQVDAIFSRTRKRGLNDLTKWNQVGLSGSIGKNNISLYGRNSASGTYGYFKSVALKKGDYKDRVKEQPGSSAVVSGVAGDLAGIGYSGIGYRTSDVKVLPLSKAAGRSFYLPTPQNALKGNYPLTRLLYVYVAKAPNKPLDKLTYQFLKMVLASDGQNVVVKDGYFPLPHSEATRQLKSLQ